MRRQLEYTIKHKRATLEEDVAPVPAIVFHDMVCLRLDPDIERDKDNATDPANGANGQHAFGRDTRSQKGQWYLTYRRTWTGVDKPSGTRKQENANMQYATKSLMVFVRSTFRKIAE